MRLIELTLIHVPDVYLFQESFSPSILNLVKYIFSKLRSHCESHNSHVAARPLHNLPPRLWIKKLLESNTTSIYVVTYNTTDCKETSEHQTQVVRVFEFVPEKVQVNIELEVSLINKYY